MRPVPLPPGPGQESVWAYPRPAVAQSTAAHIVIKHRGLTVADTRRSVRVIETSHPPSYYIPSDDIRPGALRPSARRSLCEWKGQAFYWDVSLDGVLLAQVGWSYPKPTPDFEILRDHVAFYAGPFDRCTVDGEVVTPQPGHFYGGWITLAVAGPFKGMPGSDGW
jgi:uncharacterized protein (DUF427 family)